MACKSISLPLLFAVLLVKVSALTVPEIKKATASKQSDLKTSEATELTVIASSAAKTAENVLKSTAELVPSINKTNPNQTQIAEEMTNVTMKYDAVAAHEVFHNGQNYVGDVGDAGAVAKAQKGVANRLSLEWTATSVLIIATLLKLK